MAFANVQTTALNIAGGGTASVAHDTAGAYNWIAVVIEGGSNDFTVAVTYGGQAIAQKATARGGASYRGDGRCIVLARVASDGSMPAAGSNTFQVVVTGTPAACKARIWTGYANTPTIASDSEYDSNAVADASVNCGTYGGLVFMAANAGGSGTNAIHSGIGICTTDLTTLSHYSSIIENFGVLARSTVQTGIETVAYTATACSIALVAIVEGEAVVALARLGERVAFRAGVEVTAPTDGTVYLDRLGEHVAWRAGLRVTATHKRQVALVGEGIETSEMTEAGTEGQVLTQHAKRKPTWEDASGGASALDDLTDVDAAAPADNDVLGWDDATSTWIPMAPGTPDLSSASLDDLGDVAAPTPTDGDVLTWDDYAAEWVAVAPAPAGDGIEAGTSFPVGPTTGDLYRRTDLERHVYRFDGTRWLTELTWLVQGPSRNNDTTSPFDYHGPGMSPFPQPENGIYLVRVVGSAYVTTTNDGTKYWRYVGPDGTTVCWSTAGISANAYTRISSTVAAGVYTAQQIRFRLEKVSTPGSIYGAVAMVFRGIGT